MGVLGADTGYLSSAAATVRSPLQKVTQRVTGLVRTCSDNMDSWVHPSSVVDGSKVGDVPDEPRQWCAFEFADLMEQGLSGGLTSTFLEVPQEEVRLCVQRSQDRKEYLLTTPDGAKLLLARKNDNGDTFSIFVTGDESYSQTLRSEPTSPGHTMQVHVAILWHVIIEHYVHSLDVHTPAEQICSYKDSLGEILELLVMSKSVVLAHSSMDRN